jgi:hypothetical protein
MPRQAPHHVAQNSTTTVPELAAAEKELSETATGVFDSGIFCAPKRYRKYYPLGGFSSSPNFSTISWAMILRQWRSKNAIMLFS